MGLVLVLSSGLNLALVWASFVSQIQHVWQTKDSRGISSAYLLFNLLCATEHVFMIGRFMSLFWALTDTAPVSFSTLDWLNLAQVLVVWVCLNVFPTDDMSLVLDARGSFALCLYHRRRRTPLLLTVYALFLLVTLLPLGLDLTTDIFCPPNRSNCLLPERDLITFLQIAHQIFVLPVVTVILPVLGFYKQAQLQRQQRQRSGRQQQRHLSTSTPDVSLLLARPRLFQSAFFALSAFLWVFRFNHWLQPLPFTSDPPVAASAVAAAAAAAASVDEQTPLSSQRQQQLLLLMPSLSESSEWWRLFGFMVVDDAIFAFGQGALGFWSLLMAPAATPAAASEVSPRCDGSDDAERRPLLLADEEPFTYVAEN
ncbi:uncharacterized protein BO66DRAFT_470336 [Aspergillus aculeatinus CBS 121060]|uniref:Uncharacterized protein n=1 Tax=Aspergillus aculeatinus CBS 121060 TaxID=1448322 RepID=A0ACD1HCN2_9EURO|nr:hypothetical protein BO66DRAFT_470336 [Aspergillus aculeatinus CBS 121060]RAH71526.1 hypothetical protein BO66DRAFT_470336 [Aspergillus aculeatinus CBS 121060]